MISMAPKRFSPRHSPEPSIENPEVCCSALILHAAAFSTLKQVNKVRKNKMNGTTKIMPTYKWGVLW